MNAIVRLLLTFALTFSIPSASNAQGDSVEQPKPLSSELLVGDYVLGKDFGHPCHIRLFGGKLAVKNEGGGTSWATFDPMTRRLEVAQSAAGTKAGWGRIGGVVSADGTTVQWDSNVQWRKITHIKFWVYQDNFASPCQTIEVAGEPAMAGFVNEKGEISWGSLDASSGEVSVANSGGWGAIKGTVTADGNEIRWNSSIGIVTWRKIPEKHSDESSKTPE